MENLPIATAEDIEKVVCYQCYAVLDAGDHFCRHCGRPLGDTPAPTGTFDGGVAHTPAPQRRLSENPWVVLAMLLLVMGPLGLPMLWRSRHFSLTLKTALTLFILGVTAAILGMIYHTLQVRLQPLMELNQLKGI